MRESKGTQFRWWGAGATPLDSRIMSVKIIRWMIFLDRIRMSGSRVQRWKTFVGGTKGAKPTGKFSEGKAHRLFT